MTDDLQFDRADVTGHSSGGVICAACHQPILDQYFSARGQPICQACRDRISSQLAAAEGNLPKGIVFGIGGAIAGAVIYFAVAAIAKVEIGLVAIAAGWLVGRAIQLGAGGVGGPTFQVIAAGLTYLSVAAAYVAVRVQAAVEAFGVTPMAAVSAISGGSPFRMLGLPITENLADLPMGALGLLIVGVGVYQAWRMTATVDLRLEGPFPVGPQRTTEIA